MSLKKIERIGLYFNLEIESESKMWEYLKGKKKSYEIKKLLENAISKEAMVTPIIDKIDIDGVEF